MVVIIALSVGLDCYCQAHPRPANQSDEFLFLLKVPSVSWFADLLKMWRGVVDVAM